MEKYLFETLVFSSVLLVLYSLLKVVYNIWWRPLYLEKLLRDQGIRGTSYKLLSGDMGEIRRSILEARSKPMSLNHHIAPRVFPFFHDMMQKYGRVCMIWIGTKPRVIIGDPELLRLILADKNNDFVKPPILNPLAGFLHVGVASLEGDQWAKRRRQITHAFHLDKLKGMVPSFSISCSNLIDRWRSLTGDGGSCEVDVASELQNFTGDAIARTAFGSNYEEGKKIFELQKEQAALVREAYYGIYIPGFRFVPTKKNRRRYKLDSEVTTILQDMIYRRKQDLSQNKESVGPNDLLGLLLHSKEQYSENYLTTEEVIDECKLFYFAGQETTANLLTWTMIILSMHPNWQERAREEVLRICGKKSPDFESINRFKIVPMIFNEVLRLYPPLSNLYRYSERTTNIRGMSIPKGVETLLLMLYLHHDPKYWGDDVEEFNPNRFLEGVAKLSKENDQIAFYPFGWGPRICLGQNFAMIEAKIGLAMILQHFWFELSSSYTHAPCTVITLKPQYGAPLILHPLL
ncbi:Cytochrome P450, E-class, group I [Trema orientale]|uniref:Cytochrome P450, E-class, group I n=1 Tax=Trema orientale TaxID=63057 RepID=A0A2P5AXJ7_TREOI|nr:Cytochrome P450, E-class, group I [Trema orientale]